MIRFAWPWFHQAYSFSPQPCCRYSTGYFFLFWSYCGGVYTHATRFWFVLLDQKRTCCTLPCGTFFMA